MPGVKDGYIILAVAFTIMMVSFGVFMIIKAGIIDGICDKLLQTGEYSPNKKLSNKKYDHIFSAYWMIITAGYLIYSFITHRWDISWIVWPIAGIIFGIINVLLVRDCKFKPSRD